MPGVNCSGTSQSTGMQAAIRCAGQAGNSMELRGGQDPVRGFEGLLSGLLGQLTGQSTPLDRPPAMPDQRRDPPRPVPPTPDPPAVRLATEPMEACNKTAIPAEAKVPEYQQSRQIRANPLAPLRNGNQPIKPVQMPAPLSMPALHAELLRRLELGQIRPDEMARFKAESNDATVDQELTWMLFNIRQLERHRLRLVQHLRAQRTVP